jgi:hypothetical protein
MSIPACLYEYLNCSSEERFMWRIISAISSIGFVITARIAGMRAAENAMKFINVLNLSASVGIMPAAMISSRRADASPSNSAKAFSTAYRSSTSSPSSKV